MAKKEISPLTESQREIMELFWELGEATVSDIHERKSPSPAPSRSPRQFSTFPICAHICF